LLKNTKKYIKCNGVKPSNKDLMKFQKQINIIKMEKEKMDKPNGVMVTTNRIVPHLKKDNPKHLNRVDAT